MDPINLIQKEGRRRGVSNKTIKTYCNCMKVFLQHYKNDPLKISKNDIKDYIDKLLEKNASNSTLNVNLMALKFFTKNILNKNYWIYNKFSKIPRKYPTVLTKQEVQDLINSISNEKHKLMIEIMYSAGLRVSELVMLKVKDLDLKNNYGYVRSGKGNKDRIFIVAQRLVSKIENHIMNNLLESDNYLFKGQKYSYYSQRSIQEIVKKAAKNAKIKKNVHCHTLRHSFATHLVEDNYDVATIQSLLGHNSAETTMMYIHMASPKLINVRSPLDSFD